MSHFEAHNPFSLLSRQTRTTRKDAAWENPGSAGTTSVKAALEANPSLPIQPVYLSLPLHGSSHPENFGRSIADDATDILAAIEGGNDSNSQPQTGILNDPAYGGATKVVIVGYSQGAISSRYYLKNLMGSRKNGAVTVSEFVALAAPNHGAGGAFSCGNENEPDRSTRELCGGMTATLQSQALPCGSCVPPLPSFTTNLAGDEAFLNDLITHLAGREHGDEAVAALARTSGFLRSQLARRLTTYKVPQLAFVYDDSIATPVADQGVSYHYFGGVQSVTAGAFTIVWNASGIFAITA